MRATHINKFPQAAFLTSRPIPDRNKITRMIPISQPCFCMSALRRVLYLLVVGPKGSPTCNQPCPTTPPASLRHDAGQCCTSHPSPRHKTVNTLQPGTKAIGAASQPHRALDLSQAHVFKRPQVQGGSLTLVWCGAIRRLTSTADGTSDPSNISQPLFLVFLSLTSSPIHPSTWLVLQSTCYSSPSRCWSCFPPEPMLSVRVTSPPSPKLKERTGAMVRLILPSYHGPLD
jgi:hypothetical protein